MSTLTITEFLEARIAEDEAEAKWVESEGDNGSSLAQHPTRVLAECAAKRAIIDAHNRQGEDDDPRAWVVASEVLLRTLAAVYVDHADYRQEWAPNGN